MAALLAPEVRALDPDRAMSQILRDRWGSERGFPGGPVYGITQTADGYLWIGADKGVVRFDGLGFRLFEPAGLTMGAGPTVLGVATGPEGRLWARLRGPELVREKGGAFVSMLADVGLPDSVVTAMYRGPGDLFLISSLGHGTVMHRDGKYQRIAGPERIPSSSFVISVAQTADGQIWMGTRDAGLLRVQGQQVTRIMAGLPDLKINCLLPTADGGLWIGTDKGIARWQGSEITRAGMPAALGDVPALAMIHDRHDNTWIAAGARGLLRVSARGVVTPDDRDTRVNGAVSTVYEDRDGNLWVGTSKGIERLRDGVFTTYSSAQGLPSDNLGPVYVDGARRTWFAPAEGGLFWMRGGAVGRITLAGLADDVVYSIAGSGDEVWVGRQRGGLTRLRPSGDGFVAEQFTQANGLAQNSVYAVHRARDGAAWAGTLSGGASRYQNGTFTTYTRANGLLSNTVTSILEATDGSMWFASPNGISTFSRGGWRHYTDRDGLPSSDVSVLFQDSAHRVWAGTAAGLTVFSSGRPRAVENAPALRAPILGITEDREGWLWLATAERVLRVHRDAMAGGVSGDMAVRELGTADGLLSVDGVKRHRSVTTDGQGRVWISMGRGLSMADPTRIGGGSMPALVHVDEVTADGAPVELDDALVIPAGRRRIALSYAGLSLSVPERVRYRYKLEGFDSDWSAPVTERQAVYTNLAPGPYAFHVAASNSDGSWSGSDAVLRFEVAPMIWQRGWFQAAFVILAGVGGWSLYRLRVYQVARQLNQRFDERLAERTRIAQELHDTLLQGFVSASMQLHVTAERLPDDSPAKGSLSHVQKLMARVIDEGRNAVRGLRSADNAPRDLAQAFSAMHLELAAGQAVEYRVVIEGRLRVLKPIIRDEVYRIGREAIVNAFRHARAASIEIELEYAPSGLRLFVRDDGCGIDPHVARKGADGHWGIAGMRERARSIGGGLKVRTRAEAGTEVELSVPGHVAFEQAPASPLVRWIRRRLGRSSALATRDLMEHEE
jgi:signal transduction histidine kinase/ligand-binding sensor domain-containing protein